MGFKKIKVPLENEMFPYYIKNLYRRTIFQFLSEPLLQKVTTHSVKLILSLEKSIFMQIFSSKIYSRPFANFDEAR
jgi:hypothetical protein